MSTGLAERELTATPWTDLRACYQAADRVPDQLRLLLFSEDQEVVSQAYGQIEGLVVAQGDLFECAPAVVRVIVAGIAESSIPMPNLGSTLEFLTMILTGHADESEVAAGCADLQARCHLEAMRGYWAIAAVAHTHDAHQNCELAADIIEMLDDDDVVVAPPAD
jgi:hypothetical protein